MMSLPSGPKKPIDTWLRSKQKNPQKFEITVIKPEIKNLSQFNKIVGRIRKCLSKQDSIDIDEENHKCIISTEDFQMIKNCLRNNGISVKAEE